MYNQYPSDRFIPHDEMLEIGLDAFKRPLLKYYSNKLSQNTDPFLAEALRTIEGDSETLATKRRAASMERAMAQGAGSFHQSVLGSSRSHWYSTGRTNKDGFLDLMPRESSVRRISSEVKNSENTLKKSDADKVFRSMERNVEEHDLECAYIIFINTMDQQCYNEPWRVSHCEENERIRCVDGRTGYALAFDCAGVFDAVMQSMSLIIEDIKEIVLAELGEME